MCVCDLMTASGIWDWEQIRGILWEVDHNEINCIPLGNVNGQDRIMWHYNSKGDYPVKSGCHPALEDEAEGCSVGGGDVNDGLRKLWKLHIPSKIKIHLCRALCNSLPVKGGGFPIFWSCLLELMGG